MFLHWSPIHFIDLLILLFLSPLNLFIRSVTPMSGFLRPHIDLSTMLYLDIYGPKLARTAMSRLYFLIKYHMQICIFRSCIQVQDWWYGISSSVVNESRILQRSFILPHFVSVYVSFWPDTVSSIILMISVLSNSFGLPICPHVLSCLRVMVTHLIHVTKINTRSLNNHQLFQNSYAYIVFLVSHFNTKQQLLIGRQMLQSCPNCADYGGKKMPL